MGFFLDIPTPLFYTDLAATTFTKGRKLEGIFLIFSEIRKDENVKKLVEPVWSPDEVKELQFHQKCLDSYVHPKSLNKFKRFKGAERSAEEDVPSTSNEETPVRKSSRKRDRLGK